jgi:hypothetical protein
MRNMTKLLPALCSVAMAMSAGLAQADPVEAVYGFKVKDPAAFVSAFDTLFQSDAVKGNRVTLWAAEFDGSSPATHVLTVDFDSYQAMDEANARRRGSEAWKSYLKTTEASTELTGSMLAIQRGSWGEGGSQHGAGAAFSMAVQDPAGYAAAFEKMVKAYGAKGAMRLMEVRAGGQGVTHIVLVSAPTMAELNAYLDGLFASGAYRTFSGEVGGIRKLLTVSMYRRVKTWER